MRNAVMIFQFFCEVITNAKRNSMNVNRKDKMKVKAVYLRDTCQMIVLELTRLQQLNRPLSIDQFYEWSEKEIFITTTLEKYGHYCMALSTLKPDSKHFQRDMLSYIENAYSRHSNVITPETYGVTDDAYLLAINVAFAISREADEME